MLKGGKGCRKNWGEKNRIKGKGKVLLTFSGVDREGLFEKMATTKDGGARGKGVCYVDLVGKSVPGRGNSQRKSLRQKCLWHIPETVKMPVELEEGERGEQGEE